MARLIDAEETREIIRNHALGAFNLSDAFEFYLKGLTKADDIIANAPTVDAVPVVRCKDCKWHEEIHGWYRCLWWHNVTEPEVFCSMGERREGDAVSVED